MFRSIVDPMVFGQFSRSLVVAEKVVYFMVVGCDTI